MKLTESYIRKLIMEELLSEQASSTQETIAQQIQQNAKNSPFIKMMNTVSPQDQFFVLQQFLQNVQIKDPRTFYTNLSSMALKLKDSTKTQTEKPVQPTAQPPAAKGPTK